VGVSLDEYCFVCVCVCAFLSLAVYVYVDERIGVVYEMSRYKR
jgi:hypothetical protein